MAVTGFKKKLLCAVDGRNKMFFQFKGRKDKVFFEAAPKLLGKIGHFMKRLYVFFINPAEKLSTPVSLFSFLLKPGFDLTQG